MAAKYSIIVTIQAAGSRAGAAEFGRAASDTQKAARQLTGASANVEQASNRIRQSMAQLRNLAAMVGFGAFVREAIQARIETERIFNTLRVGSGGNAAGELKFVREEARRLGLDFRKAASDYAQLLAAARGTKLAGEPARQVFLGISEAVTALGLSGPRASLALKAIEQMISKGRVSAEELRQQLGEQLPGAFQLAAKSVGVTTAELDRMIERGEVTAERLLPALAQELRKTFGTEAALGAKGLNAELNRMRTLAFDVMGAVGQGIADSLSEALRSITSGSNLEALQRGMRRVGQDIGTVLGAVAKAALFVAEHFGTLVSITKAWIALKLADAILSSVGALDRFAGAMKGVNAASAANPFGLIAAAVVLIQSELGRMVDAWRDESAAAIESIVDQDRKSGAWLSTLRALRTETKALTADRYAAAVAMKTQMEEQRALLQGQLSEATWLVGRQGNDGQEIVEERDSKRAAQLRIEIELLNRRIAEYDEHLKRLGVAKASDTKLTEEQSKEIERARKAGQETLEDLRREVAQREALVKAYAEGAEAVERVTKANELANRIAAATKGVLAEQREEIEKNVRASFELEQKTDRLKTSAEKAAEAQDTYTDALQEAATARGELNAYLAGGEEGLRVYQAMVQAVAEAEEHGYSITDVYTQMLILQAVAAGQSAEKLEQLKDATRAQADETKRAAEEAKRVADRQAEALMEPMKQALRSVQGLFADTLESLLNGSVRTWSDIWGAFKAIAFRAIAEVAAVWAAQRFAMSLSGGSGGAGGAGGGVNWLGLAKGASGFAGGTSYLSGLWGGMTGTASLTSVNSASAAAGANAGAGAMGTAAMAAIWVAAIMVAVNQIKTSGRAEIDTAIKFGGADGLSFDEDLSRWNNQGGLKRYQAQAKAVKALIDGVKDFIRSLGAEIDSLAAASGSLTIAREGQGKKTNWFVRYAEGLVKHFGKDMQAAFEFATIQAVRQTPKFGLDPIVAATIRDSTAEKMDEFQRQVAAAQKVANLGLSGDYAGYRQQLLELSSLRDELLKTITTERERAEVIRRVADEELRLHQAERNRLYGLPQMVDYAQRLRDAEAENNRVNGSRAATLEALNRLTAELADQEAALGRLRDAGAGGLGGGGIGRGDGDGDNEYRSLLSEWRATQAQIRKLQQQLQGLPDAIDLDQVREGIKRNLFGELLSYLENDKKYRGQILEWRRKEVDLTFAMYKAQLIAVGMWEEAAQLWQDAYNAAMAAAGKKGGGRGSGNAQTVRDALRDSRLALQDDVTQALAGINLKWDEHAKKVKGNADLLKQIAAARKDEIDALRKQLRRTNILPFLGGATSGRRSQFASQLADIQKQYDDMRKNHKDLHMSLREINQAERERIRLLGLEVQASLGIVAAQAHLEFQKMAQDLNFLKLNASKFGYTVEQIAQMTREAQTRTFLGLADNMARYITDEETLKYLATIRWETEKAGMLTQIEIAKLYKVITDEQYAKLLEIYGKLPKDAPDAVGQAQDIRDIYRDQREEAERAAAAMREAVKGLIADLRALRKELLTDEQLSPLSMSERMEEVRRQYEEALGKARGGDVDAGKSFIDLSRQYAQIARQMYAGGGGYNEVFAKILANISEIENLPRFGVGGVVLHRQLAQIGERGPEAVVPLPDGRRIPVEMRGGGLDQSALERLDRLAGSGDTQSDLLRLLVGRLDSQERRQRRQDLKLERLLKRRAG